MRWEYVPVELPVDGVDALNPGDVVTIKDGVYVVRLDDGGRKILVREPQP